MNARIPTENSLSMLRPESKLCHEASADGLGPRFPLQMFEQPHLAPEPVELNEVSDLDEHLANFAEPGLARGNNICSVATGALL